MKDYLIDENNRFVIKGFSQKRPFSSFLPGIAGRFGIPLWTFYVNRGQAIASFGVKDKDSPILEFQPANKAYRRTTFEGFRTFLKIQVAGEIISYEPFAPWSLGDQTQMLIGMNDLEIMTINHEVGLETSVFYFLLPNEPVAGLVRQVTIRNISQARLQLEILDGLPIVIPFGMSNSGLKEISRTLEAWMAVFNLESGIPFYHLLASSEDVAEVSDIQSGHFYLSFDEQGKILPVFTDPDIIFGNNSTLHSPDNFFNLPLREMENSSQINRGKTPCGFAGVSRELDPGEQKIIYSVIGHASDLSLLMKQQAILRNPGYIQEKHQEAIDLVKQITQVIQTESGIPEFDAYCRQTFLDNLLRGGVPIVFPETDQPRFVYHLFSRKHGDLERDYNFFQLTPEPFSQGNGNYRDINQNRRNDVSFQPRIGDFNVRVFMDLIQPDGYNPLVLQGTRFTIPGIRLKELCENFPIPEDLYEILSRPFRLGELWGKINHLHAEGGFPQEYSFEKILELADQQIEVDFHEGYWIDHWTYNLDLIEDYLSIFPEQEQQLLFGQPTYTYYDNQYLVKSRSHKYVKVGDRIRQYEAVIKDEEKASLIAGRNDRPHLVRGEHGRGDIFVSTLFEKLTLMALLKFVTLDPEGLGIEMEAGRPGWYDALNGLPGLFGSSIAETIELQRLLGFLQQIIEKYRTSINIPEEAAVLLRKTMGFLEKYNSSQDAERDFFYWDRTASAKEEYRQEVRLGFSGRQESISWLEILDSISHMRQKLHAGIEKELSIDSTPFPTYFYYEVVDYDFILDQEGRMQTDELGRPNVLAKEFKRHCLPPFLEGPTKLLKIVDDQKEAKKIHAEVMGSTLFDQALGMFRVNTSLSKETHEIGRARAFTPGWLENESIWTHMSFKYLLALLQAELYDEFFVHFVKALPPKMDPHIYGRSIFENCSFIVSSVHPDRSIHGAGFVARLSGAAAEFLSIWRIMMAGKNPFFLEDNQLHLALKPILPAWLFTDAGTITFTFLGHTKITYHNLDYLDTYDPSMKIDQIVLKLQDTSTVHLDGDFIGTPYAEQVRDGQVNSMDIFMRKDR